MRLLPDQRTRSRTGHTPRSAPCAPGRGVWSPWPARRRWRTRSCTSPVAGATPLARVIYAPPALRLDPGFTPEPEPVTVPTTGDGSAAHALLYRPANARLWGRRGRRAAAAAGDGARRSHRCGPHQPAFGAAVLDQSRYCRRGRGLPGKHWLRPGVPSRAGRRLGCDRRGRLRGRGTPLGRARRGRRRPAGHHRLQRRGLCRAAGAHRLRRVLRRPHPLRRDRPGGPCPRHPQVREALHGPPRRPLPRRNATSTWSAPRSTGRTASRVPCSILQGDSDPVVPPNQAEALVEALESNGLPYAYLLFEGEQHGFRGADAIVAAAEAELSFLGQIFGFEPAGDIRPVSVHNL